MRNLWLKRDLKYSIDTRRIHHQLAPMQVSYEPGTDQVEIDIYFILFPFYVDFQEVLEGLVERGHKVEKIDKFGSVVVGIEKGDDGRVYANADFRKAGGVDGF